MTSGDQVAAMLVLAGLSGIGPARLRSAGADDPARIFDELRRGGVPDALHPARDLAPVWFDEARAADPNAVADAHVAAGIDVVLPGDPGWPEVFDHDPEPPAMLCIAGRREALEPVAVGIVGTRRSSRYGESVAFELGATLATVGVPIVSGLALGIDGAAHAGSLSIDDGEAAAPIAVVAGGLDRVYPQRHRALWNKVAGRGVIVSEAPLGTAPERWRFPLRNRIIAALSRVVIVVESGVEGGSMHTVREAEARGITVMAVPGPVTADTSAGTNQLLSEGCPPCRDADDALVALGLSTIGGPPLRPTDLLEAIPVSAVAERVLDSFEWASAGIDVLVGRTGLSVPEVTAAVTELEMAGLTVRRTDGTYERTTP